MSVPYCLESKIDKWVKENNNVSGALAYRIVRLKEMWTGFSTTVRKGYSNSLTVDMSLA